MEGTRHGSTGRQEEEEEEEEWIAGAGWAGNSRSCHCRWICPLADRSQSLKDESTSENSNITSLQLFFSAALLILLYSFLGKAMSAVTPFWGSALWSVFPSSVCGNDSHSCALPRYSLSFSYTDMTALTGKGLMQISVHAGTWGSRQITFLSQFPV